MIEAINISPNPYEAIVFQIPGQDWLLKITKNGFVFNHKAYPNVSEDEFANKFVDILETHFKVKFTRKA